MVVAKQRVSGLIEPLVAGGICFGVAIFVPWLEQPIRWYDIILRIWFCLGGLFFVSFGIKAWKSKGIGLVFTPAGIEWYMGTGYPFRSWSYSYSWDEIARARCVRWQNPDGDEDVGVLVELNPGVSQPLGPKHSAYVSKKLQKQFGEVVSDNVILLNHHKWDWDAELVATWINESANDPGIRVKWTSER